MLGQGLDEIDVIPFPRMAIHVLEPEDVTLLDLASWIAACRAEQLLQWAELTGSVLNGLVVGSVHAASIVARSLLEIAGQDAALHRLIQACWGCWEHLASRPSNDLLELTRAIHRRRFSAHASVAADRGLPAAKNAMTGVQSIGGSQFGERVRAVYEDLSEVAHPNAEANGVYWRVAPAIGHRQVVVFAAEGTESPAKANAASAASIATASIIPLAQDLRRILVSLSASARPQPGLSFLDLGIPRRLGRNNLCLCGSGRKHKACDHPPAAPFIPPRR